MKKQIKQSALLLLILTILSCTDSVVEKIEDETDTVQVEILDTAAKGIFDEWSDNIPTTFGMFGPSILDAYQTASYTYVGDPDLINQIPSNKRKFRFFIFKEGKIGPPWFLVKKYELNSNKITLKLPSSDGEKKTVWAIGCHAFNTNTGIGTSYQWKTVTVNN